MLPIALSDNIDFAAALKLCSNNIYRGNAKSLIALPTFT
jgi:hypothetical protein